MATRITLILLVILGVVFILQNAIPGLTQKYWFDPSLALSQPWIFVTSIFLHANILHIFFNAFALFMFGLILERYVSTMDYLIIFFLAGISGGILYYLTYLIGIIPAIPALGASGAIYGLMAALAVMEPNLQLRLFFIIPMKIRDAVILWFILETIGVFSTADSGIASAAHVGGIIFGVLYAHYFIKSKTILKPKYEWEY